MKNKVFLLAVLASISDVVMAKDFWQCVQANGKTVFSDLPCPKGQEQLTVVTRPASYVSGLDDTKKMHILPVPIPTPAISPPVVSNTTRNHQSAPINTKMTSLECNNAKRAWKFEGDKLPSKDFNRTRIIADVIRNCGGWPVSF